MYCVDLRITTHHSVPGYPVVSLIRYCCCGGGDTSFSSMLFIYKIIDFVFFKDSLQTRDHLNKFTTLY